jgi:tripartite-type tricarboxylate transporter receptor subunit TctC
VARMNSDVRAVLGQPDMREQFASRGDEPVAGTPEQAADYVRSELAKWGKVIKEANIKAN